MPSFVIIITALSVLSFLYAMKAFLHEGHQLQRMTAPFGGSIPRMAQQVLRVSIAALFTALALVSVLMSLGLVWLSMQPGFVG
ncbi:MAG TPA: hypothetical protein VFO10_22260 [Oligoflexus sp.]|uniref:hypothetical protein n=1 Tax=Oligoflexus sp. TaxID=1971216 RepID=UPI002D7FBAC4|nr:hypothetical protein [Oligoflexus sp.]HET9240002.1 hypothetical protein [Oligoflexus sp.]